MVWTGLLNYFIVKKSWRPANKAAQPAKAKDNSKNKEEIELAPLLNSNKDNIV